jgi:hypothetical protein
MSRFAVLASRVAIVAMIAGLLFVQTVLLPLLAIDLRDEAPELGALRWVIVGTAIAGAATIEVALVCVWQLLTMVRRDTVFSRRAFRYVDVIIGATAVGAVLAFALGCSLAPGEAVPPGGVLFVGLISVAAVGIALLVLVLRQLLAKAVALDTTAGALRAELDEVI